MTQQIPQNDQARPAEPDSLLNRFLLTVERFAYTHPFPVIIVSILVAVLSLWVTVERLTFKTGRGDLVAKDLPYVQRHDDYRQEFEDFDGMIVVVEDADPVLMKSFAEALVEKFKSHPEFFSEIFYKIDTSYFQDKALLYLDRDELEDLRRKINEHKQFLNDVNASPGLNQLMRSINLEISSGMVASLLTDFLGTGEEETGPEKDDSKDLSLLITLLKEMLAHLKGETRYRSPWTSFFTGKEDSLAEEGYLVSGNLLFILVVLDEDKTVFTNFKDSVVFSRKLIADTKAEFPGVQVGLTGEDVIASDEMVAIQRDIGLASGLALAGVALLFILAFRGVVKPLLAVFCLLVGLSWSMGFTTLTVGHLNILSVVFTTILIGLGIDFGIHMLERYKEERQRGQEILEALQKTVQGTGRGNFAGAITTAIAFGAMTLTDFVGIAELGWIAAGGILLCMLTMILLLPALVTVEERWRKIKPGQLTENSRRKPRLEKLFDHYQAIIIVSLVLVVVSAASLKDVAFDYNLLNLQAKGTEAVRYEMKILENADRSAWSTAVIADSLEEARKKHKLLEALPVVADVESIFSAIPDHQAEKLKIIRALAADLLDVEVEPEDAVFSLPALKRTIEKIRFKLQGREEKAESADPVRQAAESARRFVDEIKTVDEKTAASRLAVFSEKLFADYRGKMADLLNNLDPATVRVEELPENLRNRFIGKTGKYLVMVHPAVDIWDIDQRQLFLKKMKEIDPGVAGNAVHMFESSRLMKEGYIHGGIYAMIAIILFVLYLFRNPRTVAFVFLPVVAGSLWTIGLMDLMDIRFNLANLVILPLILGIGIVNGIHIIHRYREETDKETTVLSKSTGQAVVLSSLTTMIGFGSMMVADHQGIYSLGLILTIGVGCCMVASITFLPAVLKLCTAKGWQV